MFYNINPVQCTRVQYLICSSVYDVSRMFDRKMRRIFIKDDKKCETNENIKRAKQYEQKGIRASERQKRFQKTN